MSEQATEVMARLRETFDSGRTRDLDWREAQLDVLLRMVTEREDDIVEAFAQVNSGPKSLAVYTLSHVKPVLRKPARILEPPVLRPPYQPWMLALGKKFF